MKNLINMLNTYVLVPAKTKLEPMKSGLIWMLYGMLITIAVSAYIQRDRVVETAKQQYSDLVSKTVETIQPSAVTVTKAEAAAINLKEQEDQRIGEYIMFIMNFSKVKISEFQKQLLAQAIVRVSGSIFDTETERQYFVVLINNESGFDRAVKSPAGAVGLTQVMPQFISEFGGHCDIEVNPSEVMDTETNLLLGACRFKHLLNAYKGVVTTALAAYNAGKHAKSVKELQKLEKITNEETLQYIARFAHVTATADANFKFVKTTAEVTPESTSLTER